MLFLAVDIGSSYIKSALLETSSMVITEVVKIPSPQRLPNANPYAYEVDAAVLYQTFEAVITPYLDRHKSISGLLLSTQMHGCVVSTEGSDIYISWQDTMCLTEDPGTGNRYLDQLRSLFPPEDYADSGIPIKPASAFCNLYARNRSRPFPQDTPLFTLGSYVIYRMTGENICHITNAAPVGMVNLHEGKWRHDLWARAGLDIFIMPEITADFRPCGMFAYKGRRLMVFPDIGDQQAAMLGMGVQKGEVAINIGTAGQIIRVSDTFTVADHEIRPYLPGLYLEVISRLPSGRNFDMVVDFIAEIGRKIFYCTPQKKEIWQKLYREFSLDNAEGLEADIAFYDQPDRLADGSIRHINNSNLTLRNLMSAFLHDLGRVYARYLKVLCMDVKPERLLFCGGAVSNNPMIMYAVGEATGIPTELFQGGDEVLTGLLKIADFYCKPKRRFRSDR